MGILTKIKNSAQNLVTKAGQKAADKIAAASQLSPEQVRAIDDRRAAYLSEMPSMDNEAAEENTKRNLGAVSIEINNSYLPQISELYLPISEPDAYEGNSRIAYFEVTKWVKNSDENNIEKMMSVYQVLSNENCNIALIYNRKKDSCHIYFAVVNNSSEGDPSEVQSLKNRLIGALKGNFPGSTCVSSSSNIKGFGVDVPPCLKADRNDNGDDIYKSVACVSNIATEKSEKFISQTIEKVLDGIVPLNEKDEYTIVLLATPLLNHSERIDRMYQLYSALAPYSNWQTNFTFTEANSLNSSASFGVNIGASVGQQSGTSNSESDACSRTDSTTKTDSASATDGTQTHLDGSAHIEGGAPFLRAGASVSSGKAWIKQTTTAVSKATGLAKTVAKTATKAVNIASNFGINAGANFARISSVTATLGKNEGITQSFVNYSVKHTLENLEKQVKRLEESAALGSWDFAAYVISENSDIANNVAHTYMALTQGEESYLAESSVNLWRADLPESLDVNHQKEQAKIILTSLSRLQHPEFCLNLYGKENNDFFMYPTCVNATVSLSGKELSRALNFPGKSIIGVPVIETAAFGRNVSSYNPIKQDLDIGNAYHMHSKDDVRIKLNKNSLTSHVFITGSTGSGKSNTVIELLKKSVLESKDTNTSFLVIEPAKGEYKDLIGGYSSVRVYGTNPNKSELLRINPFSFPKDITVTEHIDRLVEILNVCWPMYAAMPAILKDAIIKAYEAAGWDMESSCNAVDESLYPGFVDVMNQVNEIIESSEYSSDTKGDYVGALISRIKSLTNGVNGQIISMNEISNDELFNHNVVIDLSRVGSVETKSLLMGVLLLKLQEFRLSEKKPNIKELQHITVLEEAHNLLRRTSIEQNSESANLLGKSVEMISNSIAEMRAFGEGFIIADQAPELLDMSVIRNTNTKIVHRLPDQSDRELVGKAMGMSDAQISELAKLELGVAAVYQNDWIEPVLCKIDELEEDEKKPFVHKPFTIKSGTQIKKELTDYLIKKEVCNEGSKDSLKEITDLVKTSQMSVLIKKCLIEYWQSYGKDKIKYLSKLLYHTLNAKDALQMVSKEDNVEIWKEKLKANLGLSLSEYTQKQIELTIGLIIYEQYDKKGPEYRKLFIEYTDMVKGSVM